MFYSLNNAECKYSAKDQEFVAIVMALIGGTICLTNDLCVELIMLIQVAIFY